MLVYLLFIPFQFSIQEIRIPYRHGLSLTIWKDAMLYVLFSALLFTVTHLAVWPLKFQECFPLLRILFKKLCFVNCCLNLLTRWWTRRCLLAALPIRPTRFQLFLNNGIIFILYLLNCKNLINIRIRCSNYHYRQSIVKSSTYISCWIHFSIAMIFVY